MRSRGLVVVPLALLAGCGGSSSNDNASTETVQQTRTVEVVQDASGAAKPTAPGFDANRIYARDAPGVVTVLSIFGDAAGGLFGGGGSGNRGAEGSGFVVSGTGEIVTNAHVVTEGKGTSIHKVAKVYVRFQDNNQVAADIVGFDPDADVALLKVDPKGLTLRPLRLGVSHDLAVGSPVAAIGSPFGEEQSLSIGVISATDRTIDSLTDFSISGAIQTDAAINHGNSGGPLVDAGGRVLGINSQIKSDSGDGTGVGFAVPADLVKRSLTQLRAGGRVEYPYLGVSTSLLYPQLAQRLKLPVEHGVVVNAVVAGGPAAGAGLQAGHQKFRFQATQVPRDADVITAVGDQAIRTPDQLGSTLLAYRPGQVAKLSVIRGGKRRTIDVKLGRRPAQARP